MLFGGGGTEGGVSVGEGDDALIGEGAQAFFAELGDLYLGEGGDYHGGESGELFFGEAGEVYYGSGDDIYTGEGGLAGFADYFTHEDFAEGEFAGLFNPEEYNPEDFDEFFDLSTFEAGDYGSYATVGDEYVEFGEHFDVFFGERADEALEAEAFFADILAEELQFFAAEDILENVEVLDYQGFGELPPDLILEVLITAAGDPEAVGAEGPQWVGGAIAFLEPEDIFTLEQEFLQGAVQDFAAEDFLGIPDDQALALFEATFLEDEGGPISTDDGVPSDFDPQAFAESLEGYGQQLGGFLGAMGREQHDALGAEVIVEVLLDIDLGAADFDPTVLGGEAISSAIAVLDELQIDRLGDEYISDAIGHIAITDFDWTGEVASGVIDVLGLDELLASGKEAGVFGSYDLETADRLAETLGDAIYDVIGALNFDVDSEVLDGSAFLEVIDPGQLEVDDLTGLFNSAAEIFQVNEGNLSVAVDTLLGSDGLDLVDTSAFSGAIAGLSGDILSDILSDAADAANALGAVDGDRLNSEGADFGGIIAVATAFDLFADLVDTVLVDGDEIFTSLVEDGGLSLDDDALDFFGGLFS